MKSRRRQLTGRASWPMKSPAPTEMGGLRRARDFFASAVDWGSIIALADFFQSNTLRQSPCLKEGLSRFVWRDPTQLAPHCVRKWADRHAHARGRCVANEDSSPPDAPKKSGGNQDLWRLLGLGTQLAVTVAVFAAAGWWLERNFGWPTWSRLAISLAGIGFGLYQFVKDTNR